jgi:hypothetical protein
MPDLDLLHDHQYINLTIVGINQGDACVNLAAKASDEYDDMAN